LPGSGPVCAGSSTVAVVPQSAGVGAGGPINLPGGVSVKCHTRFGRPGGPASALVWAQAVSARLGTPRPWRPVGRAAPDVAGPTIVLRGRNGRGARHHTWEALLRYADGTGRAGGGSDQRGGLVPRAKNGNLIGGFRVRVGRGGHRAWGWGRVKEHNKKHAALQTFRKAKNPIFWHGSRVPGRLISRCTDLLNPRALSPTSWAQPNPVGGARPLPLRCWGTVHQGGCYGVDVRADRTFHPEGEMFKMTARSLWVGVFVGERSMVRARRLRQFSGNNEDSNRALVPTKNQNGGGGAPPPDEGSYEIPTRGGELSTGGRLIFRGARGLAVGFECTRRLGRGLLRLRRLLMNDGALIDRRSRFGDFLVRRDRTGAACPRGPERGAPQPLLEISISGGARVPGEKPFCCRTPPRWGFRPGKEHGAFGSGAVRRVVRKPGVRGPSPLFFANRSGWRLGGSKWITLARTCRNKR